MGQSELHAGSVPGTDRWGSIWAMGWSEGKLKPINTDERTGAVVSTAEDGIDASDVLALGSNYRREFIAAVQLTKGVAVVAWNSAGKIAWMWDVPKGRTVLDIRVPVMDEGAYVLLSGKQVVKLPKPTGEEK